MCTHPFHTKEPQKTEKLTVPWLPIWYGNHAKEQWLVQAFLSSMTSIAKQLEQVFAEQEHLAEDILVNKQLVVDYDRKRNSNREALSAMKKTQIQKEKKLWVSFGDWFIKLPASDTKQLIEQEQHTLDQKIDESRTIMKQRAAQLHELQGDSKTMLGFDLVGMKASEAYNINKAGR